MKQLIFNGNAANTLIVYITLIQLNDIISGNNKTNPNIIANIECVCDMWSGLYVN